MSKRVLTVDDSPTMRRIIVNSLKKIGFSDIIEADNGVDALEKLNSNEVDLIITDWNMPEMNGEQFVKALRSDEKYKTIPILMITTRGMKDDVLTAVKMGVNGYVVKPFTPDVLKQKLSGIISF
jgi:two-component system, chemotaxis family, chemotaxis protein CheY